MTLTVRYCSSSSSKSNISMMCVSTYPLWTFTPAFNRWTLVSVYLNTFRSLASTTLICWAHLRIRENRWQQPDSRCVTKKTKNRNYQRPASPDSEFRVSMEEWDMEWSTEVTDSGLKNMLQTWKLGQVGCLREHKKTKTLFLLVRCAPSGSEWNNSFITTSHSSSCPLIYS